MSALSQPLPLRLTSVWGGFRAAQPIPHRYGTTGGTPVQYDQARRQWVWADHASGAIDSVLVDGQPVQNWAWRNGADAVGSAVTFIEFDAPVEEGSEILARGRGKLHARTGAVIVNPADAVHDVLANIAGMDVTEAQFDGFRVEAAELEIAGSIEVADTAQTVVRGICASVGAVFSADMVGLCRLWPGGDTPVARETIDGRFALLDTRTTLEHLATDLMVLFDYEDGQPRHSLRIDAPDAIERFGRRVTTLEARWLRTARSAYSVGARLLAQSARPQWAIAVGGIKRQVRVGDAVALSHPGLPATGTHLVLGRTADLAAQLATLSLRAPVGTSPAIRIVSQSTRHEREQFADASVQTIAGQRILTLREESGAPIVGAAVLLNGTVTRYTDAGGRVSFPVSLMPAGEHTLLITTEDGRRLQTLVVVQ